MLVGVDMVYLCCRVLAEMGIKDSGFDVAVVVK